MTVKTPAPAPAHTPLSPERENQPRGLRDRLLASRTLSLLAVILLCCAPAVLQAQSPSKVPVLDSTLRLLQALRQEAHAPPALSAVLASDEARVSVRFRQGWLLSSPPLAEIERALGVEFTRLDGRIAELGGIYGARVPWPQMERLAAWPGVARIDSLWKPAVATALDASVWETHAVDVWAVVDSAGWPITGRGIQVAIFDTGIDVFHPDFWRADGGTFPWLDVNRNGELDPSIDGVDLNRNGALDASELLGVVQSGYAYGDPVPGTGESAFEPTTDWLYNDANHSGQREFGPNAGFAEDDPTYGEQLFLLADSNGDGTADPSETLIALRTSKVHKTLDADGTERTGGTDLLLQTPDSQGHGTHTASILCGGIPGRRRYVGVAPDSRLLMSSYVASDGSLMYDTAVPWAESAGAHVMLYEFGSWVQEFLDGSSNMERMLDSASGRGAVQVAVAGNLSGMQKHAHAVLAASQMRDLRLLVPYGEALDLAWVSILWQGDAADLSVELAAPQGQSAELAGDGSVVVLGDHRVRSLLDLSPRGTVRFDILIYRDGGSVTEGSWTLQLRSTASAWTNVNAYVADSAHDWSGGVIFLDQVDDMYTVTSPGTADRAITVGSYATRGRYGGVAGALSPFSGQGPRLDGERVVDVAAPGHYADVACASSGSIEGAGFGQYGWFGGTSAAAPQAAGAAALLLQQSPSLSPSQVAQAIRTGARQDPFTGVAPNHRWGWGKLDVGAAASVPRIPTPTPRARILLPIAIKTR